MRFAVPKCDGAHGWVLAAGTRATQGPPGGWLVGLVTCASQSINMCGLAVLSSQPSRLQTICGRQLAGDWTQPTSSTAHSVTAARSKRSASSARLQRQAFPTPRLEFWGCDQLRRDIDQHETSQRNAAMIIRSFAARTSTCETESPCCNDADLHQAAGRSPNTRPNLSAGFSLKSTPLKLRPTTARSSFRRSTPSPGLSHSSLGHRRRRRRRRLQTLSPTSTISSSGKVG